MNSRAEAWPIEGAIRFEHVQGDVQLNYLSLGVQQNLRHRDAPNPRILPFPSPPPTLIIQHACREMRYLKLLLLPSIVAAGSTSCPQTDIDGCVTTAVSAVCGSASFSDPNCLCISPGISSIALAAGSCIFSKCLYEQAIDLAYAAQSNCSAWISANPSISTSGDLTTSYSAPTSTKLLASSRTGTGLTITDPATLSNQTQSANPGSNSPRLSTGAKAGIAVGASVLLLAMLLSVGVFIYRRRKEKKRSFGASELHSGLPGKYDGAQSASDIPLRELHGDDLVFGYKQDGPVEADSRSARAGHPSGTMAGTEATAFDFESQKVLLEPGVKINFSSRGSNASSPH